jgi:hypothetical protein
MLAASIAAAYARELRETVKLRRFTGAGAHRPMFEVSVRGKIWGYAPHELVGGIIQGDRRVLVLVADLLDRQFALPLTTNEKVFAEGRELAIVNPGVRKAPDGALIAYELQVRG